MDKHNDVDIDSIRSMPCALLLIEAMKKLHAVYIHAGTEFEDRCLKEIGFRGIIGHINEYRDVWERLYQILKS